MQDQLVELRSRSAKTCVFVTHSVQEAVYLADRVVVMGRAPLPPVAVALDLPRPRPRTDDAFAAAYREVDGILRSTLRMSAAPPAARLLLARRRRHRVVAVDLRPRPLQRDAAALARRGAWPPIAS